MSDPEPWPYPVDGADLLDELTGLLQKHLSQSSAAAIAEALWILHTYALEAAAVSPLLAFVSPTKRCGKTTALALIGALVRRPLPASNITSAALFRTIESLQPTLLIDEADTFLALREELRGILNGGHTRLGAFVIRTVGDEHEPRHFSTWGAKAIAMIGQLPDTIADRSLVVGLQRRRRSELVERFRPDRLGELEVHRQKSARWAEDNLERLRSADPSVPSDLNDRAQDNWRPLLAIADAAGGSWPARARQAARLLSGSVDDEAGPGIQVLEDLRGIFTQGPAPALPTELILRELAGLDERPWSEWKQGKPLTAPQLARLLKPFGIKPQQWREHEDRRRGYRRRDLEQAWDRYLSAPAPDLCRDIRDESSQARVPGHTPVRASDTRVTDRRPSVSGRGAEDVTGVTGTRPSSGPWIEDLLDIAGTDAWR